MLPLSALMCYAKSQARRTRYPRPREQHSRAIRFKLLEETQVMYLLRSLGVMVGDPSYRNGMGRK